MNITLIGMPGSGKSFIGKKLADQLGFSLVEADKIIEQEFNLPLQQVVEKLGSDVFLDKEAETVIKSTDGRNNFVVSPGGSIVYRLNAINHLKKISKVFYLEVSLKVLKGRIGDVPRGIVNAENKTFADLYAERAPLYKKFADYVVNGDLDSETVIEKILLATEPSASVV
ncbi:MAG: shikimate kinase [Patescibacteria group bacterium]|nr:shikimate kinase [Patescibacteria group bacterium]